MKKAVLALSLIMGLSFNAGADSLFSPAAQGAQIASVVAKVLASDSAAVSAEAKAVLAEVINPQDYENRVSIVLFACAPEGRQRVSCDIEIGTDNMGDDDRGWGSIQRVTVDGVMSGGDFKVEAATLFFIAG